MSKKKIIILVDLILLIAVIIGFGTVYAIKNTKIKQKNDLGNKYLTEAKYEEAIIVFEEVIAIDKKNVDARIGASKAYVAIKKVDKAEKVLNDGLGYTPKEARLYLELSTVYLGENKVEEAISTLDEGISKTKDNDLKNKLKEISDDLEIKVMTSPLQLNKTSELMLVRKSSNTVVSANWNTKSDKIGKIEGTGEKKVKFVSISIGKETIISKVGSVQKEAEIEVKSQVAATISIDVLAATIRIGDNVDVKATVKDLDGKDMDVEPAWTIEGDAKLNSDHGKNNKFNCINKGEAKITVTYENVKSTLELKIDDKENVVVKKIEPTPIPLPTQPTPPLKRDGILVRGIITDIDSGYRIANATVSIRKYGSSGSFEESSTSNQYGEYSLNIGGGGRYQINIQNEGYLDVNTYIDIDKNERNEKNIALLAKNNMGEYTVRLEWNNPQSKLGLTIFEPTGEIYGDSSIVGCNSKLYQGSYYEYFVMRNKPDGLYKFLVDNKKKNLGINLSDAKVTVYKNENIIKEYNISATTGLYWNVFDLSEGKVVDINKNESGSISYFRVVKDYIWPIPNIKIMVREGHQNETGNVVYNTVGNKDGWVMVTVAKAGEYTMEGRYGDNISFWKMDMEPGINHHSNNTSDAYK